MSDPAARAELRGEQAISAAVAGRTHETIEIAAEVLPEPAAEPRVLLSALVQSTLARAVLGRYEGLEADFDRADVLAEELHAFLPLARDQVGITRAMWLRFHDLDAAAAVADAGWQRAVAEGGTLAAWTQLDRRCPWHGVAELGSDGEPGRNWSRAERTRRVRPRWRSVRITPSDSSSMSSVHHRTVAGT